MTILNLSFSLLNNSVKAFLAGPSSKKRTVTIIVSTDIIIMYSIVCTPCSFFINLIPLNFSRVSIAEMFIITMLHLLTYRLFFLSLFRFCKFYANYRKVLNNNEFKIIEMIKKFKDTKT